MLIPQELQLSRFPVYTLVYTNVAKYSVYKEKSSYLN